MATSLGQLEYTLTLNNEGFEADVDASSAQMDTMAAKATETNDEVQASYAKTGEAAAAASDEQSLAADKNVESSDKSKAAQEESAGGFSGTLIAAAALTAGIDLLSDKTIKAATDFREGMTTIVTGAGASESSLKGLSSGVLSLADATGESTTDLTNGLYMIESAGYRGGAALDVLKAAAQGAKVGNADLGTVAAASTTVMHDYANANVSAVGATNVLVATVANGKTTMDDLSSSLSHVLPAANAAGVGLTNVMGTMASLTNAGFSARLASTDLSNLLTGLTGPTAVASAAMTKFGLDSQTVADTAKKSIPDAIQMVTDAIGKKFPQGTVQFNQALSSILGGATSVKTASALMAGGLGNVQANIDAVTKAQDNGAKSVTGWAETQKDAATQEARFKESIATAGIALGEGLLPAMTKVMEVGAALVEVIGQWTTKHKTLAATIVEVVGAASVMVLGIIAVGKAIEGVNLIMDLVDETNPWILAIMAIALAAIIIMNYWTPISHFFEGLWSGVKQIFSDFLNWAKANWGLLLSFIIGPMGLAIQWIVDNWSQIKTFFSDLWKDIVSVFTGAGTWLYDIGKSIIDGLVKGIQDAVGDVVSAVEGAGNAAVNAAKSVLKIFSPSQVFAEIGQNVSLGFAQGIKGASSAPIAATQNLSQAVTGAGSTISGMPSSNAQSGSIVYNIAQVVLSTADAVDEFFSVGNRNGQLEGMGVAPIAGTTGI